MKGSWIEAYDATLRESKQGMGINFSVDALKAIIGLLDELGVDTIETGWPGANRAWDQLYEAIETGSVPVPKTAKLAAFASTRRAKKTVETDELFSRLLAAPVKILTVFGKSWLTHVTEALQTTPENNLAMVRDSIRAIVRVSKRAIFDAEHFFQAVLRDGDSYPFKVLEAALLGGADTLALCDTNGVAYPWEVENIVAKVVAEFGQDARIGVHFHGDRGQDVANTITALRAGARHFQGTVNGYSERVRMACTIETLANLKLLADQGETWAKVSPAFQSELCKRVSREVDRWAGLHPYHRKPFTGRCCSTHKAGVHASAGERRGYDMYESHDPSLFGRRRHIVLSGMAGRANVIAFTKAMWGQDMTDRGNLIADILAEIEKKEDEGYSFDSCSGSAALLVAQRLWPKFQWFTPRDYHFSNLPRALPGELLATVEADDSFTSAKGDGPIDALFNAALEYLLPKHSCLSGLRLDEYLPYQLRAGGKESTASVMRVEIDWEHSQYGSFTTQGVSTNVIDASWEAIVEAVKLVLIHQWRCDEAGSALADTAEFATTFSQ